MPLPRDPRQRRVACVLTSVAAVLVALIASAGCANPASGDADASPSPTPTVPQMRVAITPRDGARDVHPEKGIAVHVKLGTLVRVTVQTSGDRVTGSLDPRSTGWSSDWTLNVGTRYVVQAVARDAQGNTITQTSTFRTLTPKQSFSCRVWQAAGETYGVGMPVMLEFSRPITDRRAVERSLVLTTSKRVVGAWYWNGDQNLFFRPRDYWPPNTQVALVAHLNGIEAAPGVYGTHTLRQAFNIGRSLIVVADTQTHRVRVYLDKRKFATWPMSAGKPGKETPNGTYLTIEKANPVRMRGEGYDITVPWSVRFTWSGSYLHAAPWSVGSQGSANVSHGCVNLHPEAAQTYYELDVPGDPVTVTGSPKAGKWDDGWTMWFLSWSDLLKGSALHEAVIAGPDGSRFVKRSTLHSWKAKPPIRTAAPGNAEAE